MYNKLTNKVRALKSTSGLLFPGLPRFSRSSASVYYTERKLKNKKRGRPGNEAKWYPGWQLIFLQTCLREVLNKIIGSNCVTDFRMTDHTVQSDVTFTATSLVLRTWEWRSQSGWECTYHSSLVSRPHFSRPPEKWVWSTAYSIFVQVRRNVGALFFSNLTFDVIKDCIPHCVRTIYKRLQVELR